MTVSEDKFRKLCNLGEDDRWDYKSQLKIKNTKKDKKAFAEFVKDVLAFANSGGGHLLIGVAEVKEKNKKVNSKKFKILGIKIEDEIDQADLGNWLTSVGLDLIVKLRYFNYQEDGETKRVGLIYIPPSTTILILEKELAVPKERPVSENNKDDIVVRRSTIYYRQNTKSEPANCSSVKKMVERICMTDYAEITHDNSSIVKYKVNQVKRINKQFRFLIGVFKFLAALFIVLKITNLIAVFINWQFSFELPSLIFNILFMFFVFMTIFVLFFSWFNHDLLSINSNKNKFHKYIDFGFFNKGDGLITKLDFITRGPKLIEKQGNEYIVSRPTRECIYPAPNGKKCSGKIRLIKAPEQEKWQDYVGICSKCEKQHSYTIDKNGLAKKANINWDCSLKNTQ